MTAFENPVRSAVFEIAFPAKRSPTKRPFSNGERSVVFHVLLHSLRKALLHLTYISILATCKPRHNKNLYILSLSRFQMEISKFLIHRPVSVYINMYTQYICMHRYNILRIHIYAYKQRLQSNYSFKSI